MIAIQFKALKAMPMHFEYLKLRELQGDQTTLSKHVVLDKLISKHMLKEERRKVRWYQ